MLAGAPICFVEVVSCLQQLPPELFFPSTAAGSADENSIIRIVPRVRPANVLVEDLFVLAVIVSHGLAIGIAQARTFVRPVLARAGVTDRAGWNEADTRIGRRGIFLQQRKQLRQLPEDGEGVLAIAIVGKYRFPLHR